MDCHASFLEHSLLLRMPSILLNREQSIMGPRSYLWRRFCVSLCSTFLRLIKCNGSNTRNSVLSEPTGSANLHFSSHLLCDIHAYPTPTSLLSRILAVFRDGDPHRTSCSRICVAAVQNRYRIRRHVLHNTFDVQRVSSIQTLLTLA